MDEDGTRPGQCPKVVVGDTLRETKRVRDLACWHDQPLLLANATCNPCKNSLIRPVGFGPNRRTLWQERHILFGHHCLDSTALLVLEELPSLSSTAKAMATHFGDGH